jgi:hypothetical protein
MKKFILILSLIFIFQFFSACLIFHKISFEIELDSNRGGTATVFVHDIRTDAATDDELEEDKKNLFVYMHSSSQFLEDLRKEGKEILIRNLELNDDTLNAQVVYKFDDVTKVEGIAYEAGFYYLTLPLEDVIISTNGEIIESEDFKRILWDESLKTIKFEMLSFPFAEDSYESMAQYYKPKK